MSNKAVSTNMNFILPAARSSLVTCHL